MSIKSIEQDFIEKVSAKVRVLPDGRDRFRVFTPFRFDDGDHIAIVLKKEQGRWLLSDGGHTYMHLTYDIDESKLFRGTRHQIISNALSTFKVEDRFGELILEVKDARFGDALYAFAQALVKMGDVLCLSKEHVQSTFIADFQALFHEVVPEEKRDFDWNDPERDEEKKYTVDCRINGMPEPLFVYALFNNDRIRDATIKLQKVMQWDIPFRPLGIFQNRGAANRQVVARFDDVCPAQFSSLEADRQEIVDYLGENIQRSLVQ
ncbi:MAG: DUF1828 domain-containing protein [Candidatus Poribacteria bacterium]|nr:DUF1828 domain-containing protein [Candidatus Poribacteria bacterium]